ncbi:Single-stranded DNA-binding protein RIM1 [Escovopsis weberi]|uniref:Single-stranded DNA-binding protein RIM1 n=1 Tax=Escovopsis weberi TaxID=150374 RepID=A0A0M8N0V6_ESCWE|nr:Single-stranded DNA-binding protein RIM1 [Escovopsis weberi]
MSFFLLRRATGAGARSFSTSSPRSLAKMSIIGNLVMTPEAQPTSTGREILRYMVASNSGPKENRQSSFFRVTSFAEGKSKEFLMSLPKGSLVFVEGDATMSSYQDASGNNRTSLNVVQRHIEVLKRPSPPEQGE